MSKGNPGLGVMIKCLGGNEESAKAMSSAIGKVIESASLKDSGTDGSDEALYLSFTDGTGIRLRDDGQSCCEHRYMRTDDDLSSFVGATLNGAETRDGCGTESDDEVHEIEFLIVHTSKGDITVSSHNEHNGHYGGFFIVAETIA